MNRAPLDHRVSGPFLSSETSNLVKSWGEFLGSFHWQLFATATFRQPVGADYGVRAAREWIHSIGDRTYAFVGHERGPSGNRVHCHALIGGVFSYGPRRASDIERVSATACVGQAWAHGDVQVVAYDPRRGAAFYVSKNPSEGDIIGVLQRHRARRIR